MGQVLNRECRCIFKATSGWVRCWTGGAVMSSREPLGGSGDV